MAGYRDAITQLKRARRLATVADCVQKILHVRARDLIGFTMLQLMVNSMLVLLMVWYFARTLAYLPPIL